jgi:hypothetical protein
VRAANVTKAGSPAALASAAVDILICDTTSFSSAERFNAAACGAPLYRLPAGPDEVHDQTYLVSDCCGGRDLLGALGLTRLTRVQELSTLTQSPGLCSGVGPG